MTNRPRPEVVDSPPEPIDVRTEPAHVRREAFDKVRTAPVEGRPYAPTRSAGTSSGLPVGVADRGLLVQRASGLLAVFNQAGVLNPADVHTANVVGRVGQEADERVRLALALTVRALRSGSVCIDLRLGTHHGV